MSEAHQQQVTAEMKGMTDDQQAELLKKAKKIKKPNPLGKLIPSGKSVSIAVLFGIIGAGLSQCVDNDIDPSEHRAAISKKNVELREAQAKTPMDISTVVLALDPNDRDRPTVFMPAVFFEGDSAATIASELVTVKKGSEIGFLRGQSTLMMSWPNPSIATREVIAVKIDDLVTDSDFRAAASLFVHARETAKEEEDPEEIDKRIYRIEKDRNGNWQVYDDADGVRQTGMSIITPDDFRP